MNILIVDDDALIRNWLSMLLRQVDGYEVTLYEATDGMDALEVCEEVPVDLVITDIKMPRLGGIDLISTLKTKYPHIRTSVLSSYDDFDYVRIALKCGALDYILKAEMKMEDITGLLEKARRDVQLEQTLATGGQARYATLAEVKKRFACMLENPALPAEEFLCGLTPPLALEDLCLALVRLRRQDTELPQYTVAGICDDTLQNEGLQGVAFPWVRDYFLLLYHCTSPIAEHQQEEYQRLLGLLDANLEKYVGAPIAHSINLVCGREDNLRARFTQALDIMDDRQYYGAGAGPEGAPASSGRKEQAVALHKALDLKDYKAAAALLVENMARAHEMRLAPRRVKHLVTSGMNVLLTSAALMEHQSETLDRLGSYPGIVTAADTRARVEQAVEQFCAEYLALCSATAREYSPAVRAAIVYIQENYPNKMTLDEVADHVYLNRSYLSQLFKKEVELPFGDYLESVRIEKAKQLIRGSDKSMYEVAEAVGFSNQNYFTKVFKKATGVSPLKYKKT